MNKYFVAPNLAVSFCYFNYLLKTYGFYYYAKTRTLQLSKNSLTCIKVQVFVKETHAEMKASSRLSKMKALSAENFNTLVYSAASVQVRW